jgi:hypothetical protein
VAVDTTQATSSNRIKIYVNGVQVTAFDVATYPSQNLNTNVNNNVSHTINTNPSNEYWDGYLTEINFIDGQALTPNSFGTFNSYGVWQPITYGGSYGTNGFYLPFGGGPFSARAGGGGGGASAVGANATSNTGGAGGAGSASSISGSSVTYAGGGGGMGTSAGGAGGAGGGGSGATGSAGTVNTGGGGGGNNAAVGGAGGSGVVIVSYAGAQRYTGGTVTTSSGNTIHTFTSSGVLTSIFNDFSPNGNNWTPNNINVSTLGATYDSMTDVPTLTSATAANYANFGQRPFAYTPPSGFVALNTYNL